MLGSHRKYMTQGASAGGVQLHANKQTSNNKARPMTRQPRLRRPGTTNREANRGESLPECSATIAETRDMSLENVARRKQGMSECEHRKKGTHTRKKKTSI